MPEWMTYAEAARRMGVSAEAVRHRARRLKWPVRRQDNTLNKPVTVEVPDDELTVRTPGRTGVQEQEVERLRADLARALERADEANAARLKAEGMAEGLREAVEVAERSRKDAEARADREAEGRREAQTEAAQERTRATEWEEAAAQARAEAEAAQARLDAFQALPWWKRVLNRP